MLWTWTNREDSRHGVFVLCELLLTSCCGSVISPIVHLDMVVEIQCVGMAVKYRLK